MRKLLLLSLIIFSSCASHAWAVSQEQYDKYHTAKMNGNFGTIMEVVNHIIATEDPNNLTVSDFEILATGLGYFHEFGYEFNDELHGESFSTFFAIPEKLETFRTIDMLHFSWYLYWAEDSTFLLKTLSAWQPYAMTDVEGGMSPHVTFLVDWKLGKFSSDEEQYIKAEMRYLRIIKHNLGSLTYPWDAVLWLSRLSYLYHNMGNADLAVSTALKAQKILKGLDATPHLYLGEIVKNLATVAALHGYFEATDFYLGLLNLQKGQVHEYRDNSAELVIATIESYLAVRTLESDRLSKARARHSKSGWEFNEFDINYYYDYIDEYISKIKSQDCMTKSNFNLDVINKQSLGNILRVLELNKATLCGDFSSAREILKNSNVHAKQSLVSSYKGLSRSMQSNQHSLWMEEMILTALLRFQESEGELNVDLIDEIIELFLKLESSPAERELTALSSARKTKSPSAVNELRTYFNFF